MNTFVDSAKTSLYIFGSSATTKDCVVDQRPLCLVNSTDAVDFTNDERTKRWTNESEEVDTNLRSIWFIRTINQDSDMSYRVCRVVRPPARAYDSINGL